MTNIIISFVVGIVVSVILFMVFIPYLHRLKFGQTIRIEGPKEHYKKNGTPTMGGIVIILGSLITLLVTIFVTKAFEIESLKNIFLLLFPFIGYGLLGYLDDYLIIVKKNNQGVKPRIKFMLMLVLAGIYYYIYLSLGMPNTLNIFGKTIDLGFLYGIFILLFIAAVTNAVNITDGIDGLAGGLIVIALISLAGLAYYQDQKLTLAFILSLIATVLGFMIFNVNPASIFMGNTGSYALGGALAAIAIVLKVEMLMLVIGIVFVIETLSVIMQVYYFKITKGKRIFKMAPLHHHFELSGYSEWQIDFIFWSVGIFFGIIGLVMGVKLF
ncbi:MAG: phospho-N-acetylmuramoyl-pentapeptide-transferase [Bacilli bacterium]|jgi:phospho-N-acetylmuramoyl-pentapeptide-transferase|nr:phospho-N-acetylmuramoyl-pentapeptide-transferase [Acholeplasmataceae bacterium]